MDNNDKFRKKMQEAMQLQAFTKQEIREAVHTQVIAAGQELYISLTAKIAELDDEVLGLLGNKIVLTDAIEKMQAKIENLETDICTLRMHIDPQKIPSLLATFCNLAGKEKEKQKCKNSPKKHKKPIPTRRKK